MAPKTAAPSPTFAVVTGPISGTVTLPDGTEVDVSAPVIPVPDQATADAVADAIGRRYQSEGHPTDPNYRYQPPED